MCHTSATQAQAGTSSKTNNTRDRWILNGAHSTATLIKLLDKFIEMFVLCPTCKLPEIVISVNVKHTSLRMSCNACGYHAIIKSGHKLVKYILTHCASSTTVQKEFDESTTIFRDLDVLDLVNDDKKDTIKPIVWFSSTTKEAMEQRMTDELAARKLLQKKKNDGQLDNKILHDLTEWIDFSSSVQLVQRFQTATSSRRKLLKADPKMLCYVMEKILGAIYPQRAAWAPHLFQVLYNIDILTEDHLLSWADSAPEGSPFVGTDEKHKIAALLIRQKVKPLIDWLKTAEEED
jgi:Domain found in IF2B/IF5/eIF4-gamma/eIF5/eIF2-epsilon